MINQDGGARQRTHLVVDGMVLRLLVCSEHMIMCIGLGESYEKSSTGILKQRRNLPSSSYVLR
jgi:hypothetical protein